MPNIPTDLPPTLGLLLHSDSVVEYAARKYASSLPHPLKCSKCDYIAATVAESKDHWFDEHTE